MIYKLIKITIESGNYNENDLLDKLDIYLFADRITKEQYDELRELIMK